MLFGNSDKFLKKTWELGNIKKEYSISEVIVVVFFRFWEVEHDYLYYGILEGCFEYKSVDS